MIVPMPVLAAIAVAFVVLLYLAFRRRGEPRDLMRPPPVPPTPRAQAPGPASGQLPPEVEREVREMLAAGRKINAVKRVREATGLGLKEALDLVEDL